MILSPAVPIMYVNFGIAGGAKYQLRCANHTDNFFRTKNPYSRSIFVDHPGGDCACPLSDLVVTFIPDDLTEQPVDGRHFKHRTPADFIPAGYSPAT